MKYKITRRLIGYFSIVLLLFSLLSGSLFFTLFKNHTTKIHEQDLKERAISIASTLSEFQQGTHTGFGKGKGRGYGAYLRFIDDIAMSNVWLVDENARTIQMGHMGSSLSYDELPDGAEALLVSVFKGNTEINHEFTSILGVSTITVGSPIIDSNGDVTAALLLHSPVDNIDQARKDGMAILIVCILAALFFAALLSVLLAKRFIKPLQMMGNATQRICNGDYSTPTGVVIQDEIGQLASNIDELSFRLQRAVEERKDLEHMRQDFISNISHELRTPVTVIKGSLEVLEEGMIDKPEEIKEYCHEMLQDINQLQRLVNELLELSRLQNTNFQIEKNELNLMDVLTEAIHSIQRLALSRHINIQIQDELTPFLFFGDYGRLRQMFTIVLDNAVKFSNEKDIVTIHWKKTDRFYRLSICDSGCGISKKELTHIFDRFYTDHSQSNQNGCGLGLPIAKEIALRHNMEIHCESEEGIGTCFSFDIFFT